MRVLKGIQLTALVGVVGGLSAAVATLDWRWFLFSFLCLPFIFEIQLLVNRKGNANWLILLGLANVTLILGLGGGLIAELIFS